MILVTCSYQFFYGSSKSLETMDIIEACVTIIATYKSHSCFNFRYVNIILIHLDP